MFNTPTRRAERRTGIGILRERNAKMKGRFFVKLDNLDIWIEHRRKSIFLLFMGLFLLISLTLASYYGFKTSKNPLFENPATIMQHVFNTPIVISMLIVFVVVVFGIFFTSVITLAPFKRMKLYNMELEFETREKEQRVSKQFTFVSSILREYFVIIGNVTNHKERTLMSITKSVVKAYELFYNEVNNNDVNDLVEIRVEGSINELTNSEKNC